VTDTLRYWTEYAFSQPYLPTLVLHALHLAWIANRIARKLWINHLVRGNRYVAS
jgi:hypothetical protein